MVRGGYGFYWAPNQYAGLGEAAIGSTRLHGTTTSSSSVDGGVTPVGTLSNPFPERAVAAAGQQCRAWLTGAGGVIDFADQNSKAGLRAAVLGRFQHELRGGNVVVVGYNGSRTERLNFGGTQDATVNINQLDPQYLGARDRAAAAGLEPVLRQRGVRQPERVADHCARPAAAAVSAVRQRARAPRQRGAVRATTRCRCAGTVGCSDNWAVNANYTYSRLKDNQFGEANQYANRLGSALNNYDLDGEFGYSLLDVPHRVNISGTVQLPFGRASAG